MASDTDASNFDVSLGCLLLPVVEELASQLDRVTGLSSNERDVIVSATREALYAQLTARLGRLLVLELNAARVTGRLSSPDPAGRWAQFLELSSQRAFWDAQAANYPTMLPRVERILRNRAEAALRFAERWSEDRRALGGLCQGRAVGALTGLSFGAGDSHRGGQTVALLQCGSERLVYKPRSVAIDAALRRFLTELKARHDGPMTIRVPEVVERGTHGWAEFIPHQYAEGAEALQGFYRGIGHWLAVMRLLGGSDLHSENVIAHGDAPVVVDCETLFTPRIPPKPSELGQALDHAAELVGGSVLSIGLLPGRGLGLGFRGVDNSAAGMLPGQQPMMKQPDILQKGTDEARIGITQVPTQFSQNHPSPEPALARFWPDVLAGFDGMTATLRGLDGTGALRGLLAPFEPCRIRVVPRATEVYGEVARMLWHPVSLHKEGPARQRANDLLARMAANVSSAPADPEVIAAEVEDLLEGDIPFFTTLAGDGRLEGPRGTRWQPPRNLVDAALEHWRTADFTLERDVIQATLVSAYVNDGWMPDATSMLPARARTADVDARRRRVAADILRRLVSTAIRGKDGSVTWIAPTRGPTGWSVQPLEQDLYGGASGVALLVGGYLREVEKGRADPVDGLEPLLASLVHTLTLAEDRFESLRHRKGIRLRPPPPGAYIGLGSQLWARLVLADWKQDAGDGVARAVRLAEAIPESAAAADAHDVLSGTAGAIPPLLALARRTGEARQVELARALGDTICEQARRKDEQAFWTHEQWPEGVGGFAHGTTGMGWALTLLARATRESRYAELARAAFAFDEALFDPDEQNWLDLRMLEGAKTAAAWCHGAVGIGLAHVDLDPRLEHPHTRLTLRRAAAATWRLGLGWNHCACHGDLGSWELLELAVRAGEAPAGVTREGLLATLITSIEDHGPSCGLARDAFSPGLLPGLGGVAYQLLRAHPEHELPSILTLGGGAF
ncbi:type 2 lanthipeptide synthetase LanM family protein [Corallococcus macrosporus]|uniref:Lanthionine synthetase C family protein n=1 Tax=Myxococcus fulvus (strain ATCC BAA-855 / HW-1) TaxID=483219 RepID=F8CQG3_MYXFH|nr:type 2 lanthipeptide synthetase LanM family protein [Corallococcus macrosporus]AEI66695.1 Lanthionine synthetase C family protein [Corallococcus macrosporus]